MLLMQDVRDATFHGPQLLVHVMQELVQVRSIELTALNQNLQEGSGIEPIRGFTDRSDLFYATFGNLCFSSIPTEERHIEVSQHFKTQQGYVLHFGNKITKLNKIFKFGNRV